LETPKDIPILAPLIEREILYRLLSGAYGDRLRQIALADGRMVSVNRAISWIKRNYAEPFRIEIIAREARYNAKHRCCSRVGCSVRLAKRSPLQAKRRSTTMLPLASVSGSANGTVTETPSIWRVTFFS